MDVLSLSKKRYSDCFYVGAAIVPPPTISQKLLEKQIISIMQRLLYIANIRGFSGDQ